MLVEVRIAYSLLVLDADKVAAVWAKTPWRALCQGLFFNRMHDIRLANAASSTSLEALCAPSLEALRLEAVDCFRGGDRFRCIELMAPIRY